MDIKAIHTAHSIKRCQQRGINDQMIKDTIQFGDIIYKQGFRYHIITQKSLKNFHDKHYSERLKNTVVIVADDDCIVTVYKCSKASKKLKKKPKTRPRKKLRINVPLQLPVDILARIASAPKEMESSFLSYAA